MVTHFPPSMQISSPKSLCRASGTTSMDSSLIPHLKNHEKNLANRLKCGKRSTGIELACGAVSLRTAPCAAYALCIDHLVLVWIQNKGCVGPTRLYQRAMKLVFVHTTSFVFFPAQAEIRRPRTAPSRFRASHDEDSETTPSLETGSFNIALHALLKFHVTISHAPSTTQETVPAKAACSVFCLAIHGSYSERIVIVHCIDVCSNNRCSLCGTKVCSTTSIVGDKWEGAQSRRGRL